MKPLGWGLSIGLGLLAWGLLTALSFVTVTPAHLIFNLFYRPPAGTDFDGLHLGLSLLIFLPLINAVLAALTGWLIIALIRHFRPGKQ